MEAGLCASGVSFSSSTAMSPSSLMLPPESTHDSSPAATPVDPPIQRRCVLVADLVERGLRKVESHR
jgi:hypothetical protein